MTVKRTLTCTN